MLRRYLIQLVAVIAALCTPLSVYAFQPGPIFFATEGLTLYRFQIGGTIDTFPLHETVGGMTTVPVGMTVGNQNGGAVGGDVIVLGSKVYRLDNPLSNSPTLTQIGLRGGINASPVFVGNRLFGIGGGVFLVEWDPGNFSEINRWATGVGGGPGGLTHVGGNDFLFTEFFSSTLWHYTIGNTFATAVGPLPRHDYSALESVNGTLYALFALKPAGTGQIVFGTLNPADASFNQLVVLGTYREGITGLTAITNREPNCDNAEASVDVIWPPNHAFVSINVVGVTDPDGDSVTLTIVGIFQDEPVDTLGDGNHVPDGMGVGTDTALVRAERSGTNQVPGDGRVYHIFYTAEDGHGGTCGGEVTVCVPHDQGQDFNCVDGGPLYDSTMGP